MVKRRKGRPASPSRPPDQASDGASAADPILDADQTSDARENAQGPESVEQGSIEDGSIEREIPSFEPATPDASGAAIAEPIASAARDEPDDRREAGPVAEEAPAASGAAASQDQPRPDADAPDGRPEAVPPQSGLPASPVRPQPLTELSALNGAVLAYWRGERGAVFAHWRALTDARSPGDVIRLQIEEMQRAAEASLACIDMIAKRSGRIAAALKAA